MHTRSFLCVCLSLISAENIKERERILFVIVVWLQNEVHRNLLFNYLFIAATLSFFLLIVFFFRDEKKNQIEYFYQRNLFALSYFLLLNTNIERERKKLNKTLLINQKSNRKLLI